MWKPLIGRWVLALLIGAHTCAALSQASSSASPAGAESSAAGGPLPVATVQMAQPALGGKPQEVVARLAREAAASGNKLVVFPADALGLLPEGSAPFAGLGLNGAVVIAGARQPRGEGRSEQVALLYNSATQKTDIISQAKPLGADRIGRTGLVKVGVLFDREPLNPGAVVQMIEAGARMIVWLNNRPMALEGPAMISWAKEFNVAVVAANLGPGTGSMVVVPPGTVQVAVLEPREVVATAMVEVKQLRPSGAAAPAVAAAAPPAPAGVDSQGAAGAPETVATDPVSDADLVPAEWLHWHKDVASALETARREQRKVLAFFTVPGTAWTEYIEHRVLRHKDIAARIGADYVLVKIDMTKDSEVAAKLGVFRGNVIHLYDRQGNFVGRYPRIKNPQELLDKL